MKGSKDPRALHRKDHEKGASGLHTVLVPVTDGQSPEVSREKKEMKFYQTEEPAQGWLQLLAEPGKTQFCFRGITERISLTLVLVEVHAEGSDGAAH